MTQELAIMKNVQFGVRDRDHAALWFDVDMLGTGALLCIPREDVIPFIERNHITDIKNLNGKPCVVDVSDHIVRFVRLK